MFKEDYFKRNVVLLQILAGFKGFVFFFAVINILFLEIFINSFSQIGLLLAVPILASIIFQYPTGLFADKYGRVVSLKLSYACYSICMLFFIFGGSFFPFLLGFIFLILGSSFSSGAEESLLYESLERSGNSQDFSLYLSRIQVYLVVTGVFTNLAAPFVFNINVIIPYIVSLGFAIISIAITFLLTETLLKMSKKDILNLSINIYQLSKKKLPKVKEVVNSFNKPIILLLQNQTLLFLLLISIVFGGLISVFGDLFNQPLINQRFGIEMYGLIFAIATIIQTVIIWNSSKFFSVFKQQLILWFIGIWFLVLLITIYASIVFVMVSLGILWSIGTLLYIHISEQIQIQVSEEKKQASVHSLFSFFQAISASVLLFISGMLVDLFSLQYSLIIISILLSLVSIIIVLIFTFFIYKSRVE